MTTTIIQWNANGLQPKAEFKQHLLTHAYDAAFIQETHLHENKTYSVTGYQTHRRDRCAGEKGGVAAIIKNCLAVNQLT